MIIRTNKGNIVLQNFYEGTIAKFELLDGFGGRDYINILVERKNMRTSERVDVTEQDETWRIEKINELTDNFQNFNNNTTIDLRF